MHSPLSRCEAHIFLPKEGQSNTIFKYQCWFHVTHTRTLLHSKAQSEQTLSSMYTDDFTHWKILFWQFSWRNHHNSFALVQKTMSFPLNDVLLFNIVYFFPPHHAPTLSFTAVHNGFFLFMDFFLLMKTCQYFCRVVQRCISKHSFPPYGFHFTTGTAVNFQTRQIWCETEVTRQQ